MNKGWTRVGCVFCGQSFDKKNSEIKRSKHNFCSPDCYYNWSSANITGAKKNAWGGGKMVKCYQCGGEAWQSPSKIKRNKHLFCSNACYRKWAHNTNFGEKAPNWQGGKIKRFCVVCHKAFWRYPSELESNHGKYCSYICSRKERNIPTHHTKPERIFEKISKGNNLPFKYTGDGSFWIGKNPSINPDFVDVNGKKIAVEIFGDYWHSPILRKNTPYIHTLKGRKEKLKGYGWELIVFWGSDMSRKDAEQFVLNTLQKGGAK